MPPEQSVIVWDLETLPDQTAAAGMLDMGSSREAEVREALGSGFPKHQLQKIACIAALVASRRMLNETGRAPTPEELARKLHMPLKRCA